LEAIAKQSYFGKAISRPAIANYIKANYKVGENNAFFNVSLRKALQDGIAKGLLQYGETVSRFKLNDAGRKQLNSKKKSVPASKSKTKTSKPKSKTQTKTQSKSKAKPKAKSNTKAATNKTKTKKKQDQQQNLQKKKLHQENQQKNLHHNQSQNQNENHQEKQNNYQRKEVTFFFQKIKINALFIKCTTTSC